MNQHLTYYLLFCLLQSFCGVAQMGIGTTQPNTTSILDITSNHSGILVPRMTTAQRISITNPANSLIIFNIDTNCYNFYTNSRWYETCGTPLPNPPALGSSFTSFSNGSQNFSSNATCANKLISAGHVPATCNTTVVTINATYNSVLINGQCWMRQNLKEPSTSPCGAAINTGCNIWLNTSPGDIGAWGYFNTVTTDGTASWSNTEPAAGEGLLYQWSAAMNGSTAERTKGVCPTGWHIPSDCEWMYLEHGLGMTTASQQFNNTWRISGTVGSKLSLLASGGNNSSGFTALLAGDRGSNGIFYFRGTYGYFWTSSQNNISSASARLLTSYQTGVFRENFNKAHAFPIRCLKD